MARRLALAGLAAVVAAGLLWALAPGAAIRLAPVSLAFDEGAPATVVEGFEGPRGAYVVGYEHDAYLDVAVTVANGGPVPVTVSAVQLDTGGAPLLVGTEASSSGLRLRFDNCEAYHEREAMVVDHAMVDLEVLGRTVRERVPLDRPLVARSPMLWQCPDRTLDRQDDVRPDGALVSRRDAP